MLSTNCERHRRSAGYKSGGTHLPEVCPIVQKSFSMSKPIFLDVDPGIVEKNLRFNQDEKDSLQKMFSSIPERQAFKLVQPSPGFCVKTKEVGTDYKVFVNICQTDAIPPPKEITEDELLDIIETESSDFRVPMSIGEIRTAKDKKGDDAKAVDIAIHPSFFKKVNQFQSFKNFFMAVVFQGLENKYALVCGDEKIILNNRKAFGVLQQHRIHQREIDEKMEKIAPKTVMDEMTGEEPKKKVVIETLSSTENRLKEPEYRLYKKKGTPSCLIGEFLMPKVITPKEVTLNIGEDRIFIESKVRGYLLDIFVPYCIRSEKCTSSFNKSSKILTVIMPLVGG